jgi:hypothetical protein
VAVLMGAGCVAVLRLPLSSVTIALLLTSKAGLAVAPLIVVAVVVAYVSREVLAAARAPVAEAAAPRAAEEADAPPETPPVTA